MHQNNPKYGADAYSLDQRKSWYNPVAEAYNRVRPRYPEALISRVIELTQLPPNSTILELGCGPGNATVAFAQQGYDMLCIEPSEATCQLAKQNCAAYSQVKIKNITFEEWELETERFNAVLAANSIHWITSEIAYSKAAAALQNDGYLILLWNMLAQPAYEIWRFLYPAYEKYAPALGKYEDKAHQTQRLKEFGQRVIDSGHFGDLVSEQMEWEVNYSIDDYLLILSTYSTYIELKPQQRADLFASLQEILEQDGTNNVQVSYLSAFHIAQKTL
ncbi:class I SAM-dependent methyltransferase [Synechocystis sp. PCC 7509]|uniref:class I SAM-dependent methyltransferase n=1 Tax=Synechocystis sp. PCC 7509 TaxID=927677 RepID=UPI0002ABA04A|nr:class I SAM-dependent methyltransferase [Synechocystis sp. PCC 7509]